MQPKQIVVNSKTGKLSLWPMKQKMVEREVEFHLGKLSQEFEDGNLSEKCVFNVDKTHFMIDTNDGRTLTMKSYKSVIYADVVSGVEGIIMMVMLGGFLWLQLEVEKLR